MSIPLPSSSSHLNRQDSLTASANRLIIRAVPYPGESLRGYLLRLSSANGYASPLWLRELEPGLCRISDESGIINAVERLTGRSSTRSVLQSTIQAFNLPGRFRSLHPRICPLCVREAGYHDVVWEVIFACACPRHGILLIDTCPKCKAPVSWNRLSVEQCGCGADLGDGATVAAPSYLRYLNARLWAAARRGVHPIELPGFPHEGLSRLSLEQLCQLYRFLSSHGKEVLRLNRNRPETVAEAMTELEAVNMTLSEWPKGLHRLLDSYRDEAGMFAGEGLQQAFGKFYRDLYRIFSGENFSFFREGFEEYVKTSWGGIIDGKYSRIAGDRRVSGRPMCAVEASKPLSIGAGKLKKLVHLGVVKGTAIKRPSGRYHFVFHEHDLQRFSEEVKFMINLSQVRAMLGISKKQIAILVEAGVIEPVVNPRKTSINEWWFDSRLIDHYLKSMLVTVPCREPENNSIPFTKACQLHISGAEHFPHFLEAVMTGRVPVAGIKVHNNCNLASLYFSRDSLDRFRDGLRVRPQGYCSIPEVALKLGVKQEVAYHLVRRELLSTESGTELKMKGRVVSEASISAFHSAFIGLLQFARLNGKALRVQKGELDAMGILPVTGPGVDGCRQIFYRRADLSFPVAAPVVGHSAFPATGPKEAA